MAKHKHAGALFDVLKPASNNPRPSGMFGWLRPRVRRESPAAGAPAAMAAPVAPAVMVAPVAAPAPVIEIAPTPTVSVTPLPAGPAITASASEPCEGISLSFDGSRREVTLRFSYISAAICSVAMVVLLGLAYLFGQQSAGKPRPVMQTKATSEIQKEPPATHVLTLARENTAMPGDALEANPGPREIPGGGAQRPGDPPAYNEPRPPATFATDGLPRQAGLNYVLVQSYPTKEMADEALALLKREGISATIERGVKTASGGWVAGPSWYCVIGTKGFARVSGPDMKQYQDQLKAISDREYKSRGARFKAFAPLSVKWS